MREFEDWIEEKETIVMEEGNDAVLLLIRSVSTKEQARMYHLSRVQQKCSNKHQMAMYKPLIPLT